MRKLALCIVVSILLAGCASTVKVQKEIGDSSNLTGLKSYDWMKTETPPGENVRVNNPEVDGLVRNAVNASLQKKGYVMAAAGNPDFVVTWFGAIEAKVKKESIDHFYRTYGYGAVSSQLDAKKEGAVVLEYEEGTILIDVLNPESHETIWRGSGTDRLYKEMSKDQAAVYINRMVAQILKKFPRSTN